MKKLIDWMNDKKIAIMCMVTFAVSLIPVLYLAQYARPSGDDYGYSVLTHAAWLDTHSLIEVFKAGIETVKQMYVGWNGDWFTTFLFSLMPEVFAPYTFWIVPYIMVGALVLGTSIFLYYVLVKIGGIAWEYAGILISLLLFGSIQFIPSTAIGMYWYVGATHYIIPHMLALLALTFGFRFYKSGKIRNMIYASIFMFMVGGSSYFSSLLVFMVFGMMIVLCFRKRRDIFYLLVPFTVGAVGFIVQCVSPGNKVRAGESFGFQMSDVFQTIWLSLSGGITTIVTYCRETTFIFLLLLLCAVFGWIGLLKRKSTFQFRYPLLFVIFMYGLYSAMWAPVIYSAVDVSLGPATIVYFTFLLAALLSILYVEGWVIEKMKKHKTERKVYNLLITEKEFRLKIGIPVLFLVVIITIFNLGWFRNSVDKRVYDYVSSGQAEDFREQIQSQMEILLDDSIKEAYLVSAD